MSQLKNLIVQGVEIKSVSASNPTMQGKNLKILFFKSNPGLSFRLLCRKAGGSPAVFARMLAMEQRGKKNKRYSTHGETPATVVPVDAGLPAGEVKMGAFTAILAELHGSLSVAQIRQLYTKIDVDGNGGISEEEFTAFVGDAAKEVTGIDITGKRVCGRPLILVESEGYLIIEAAKACKTKHVLNWDPSDKKVDTVDPPVDEQGTCVIT